MTSAVLATDSDCTDGCTVECTAAGCTLLEVTTTGLLETGIGALPTGGASIAVGTVEVLISFSGFSVR